MNECTILIAERNRNVRELIRRELAAEGYQTATAGSAGEIKAVLQSGRALDAIVLDTEMPDTGCAAMVRLIRTARRALPVIVHGHGAEEAGEALSEKFTVFVKKSEDLSRLKAAISGVLRHLQPEKYASRAFPDYSGT